MVREARERSFLVLSFWSHRYRRLLLLLSLEEETITTTERDAVRNGHHEGSLRRACACAKVCDDFRGQNTIVLDLTEVTPIFDYFVITSATSRRQMQAIAEETGRIMKSDGERPRGVEGADSSTWILQDYGDIVVHVFAPEARQTYDLEHLWADARRIDWQAGGVHVRTGS